MALPTDAGVGGTGAKAAAAARRSRSGLERYRGLFDSLLEGVAYCRMIYDDAGDPIDFMYLDVNPAFERLTGLADVRGRLVSDAIPGVRESNPQLLSTYAEVVLTGEPAEFDVDLATLGLWLHVVATRPSAGHFLAVFEDTTACVETEAKLRESNARLERLTHEVIEAMGLIVETRDPYTEGHEQRVARVGKLIANEMGLDESEVATIETAALLHDIGKLFVPAEILTKPGTLTTSEFMLIKEHSRRGFEILKGISFPWPIADVVLQHHERSDGSGYPEGLADGNIMLAARILAVADTVEAMSSHRPYRPAFGVESAMGELRDNAGRYDPDVVRACRAVYEAGRLELG